MSKIWIVLLMLTSISHQETAATIYSVNSQFEVTPGRTPDEIAWCQYDSSGNTTGWNRLYIYANEEWGLLEQHQGAGFLEGWATYLDIHAAYFNFKDSILNGENIPKQILKYLDDQIEFIDLGIKNHKGQLFWDYVGAYMDRVRYMHRGFLARIYQQGRDDLALDFSQFYCLTNVGDLQDLLPALGYSEVEGKGQCNTYVRFDAGQLWITHGTHNNYPFLLRIFKVFNFPNNDPRVGSHLLAFSSRPGDMISKDDFYFLDSGLRVTETSLGNSDPNNFKEISPRTLPSWLRSAVACHLARDAEQWAKYFLQDRSGTHNNQWMIVDSKRAGSDSGAVIILEEAFSIFKQLDLSQKLNKEGYVASYNMPITNQVWQKLAYYKGSSIDPFPYTYDNDPRALILQRYHSLMTDDESMKYWLINNEEQDQRVGLAPRYDLFKSNKRPFGMTDCKIISPNSLKDGFVWAISGPPTSNGRFAPFDWSDWPSSPQRRLPRRYNFAWQRIPLDIR